MIRAGETEEIAGSDAYPCSRISETDRKNKAEQEIERWRDDTV
jgi:hypothetical protein